MTSPRGFTRMFSWPFSRALPRTFQGGLSLAFMAVVAIAVGIVSILTVFVLDTDLRQQEQTNLEARARAVAAVVQIRAEAATEDNSANSTVVSAQNVLNPKALSVFSSTELSNYANQVALADLLSLIHISEPTR